MPEEKDKDKRSGLQKKVSSIFQGMPDIDDSSSIPEKPSKAQESEGPVESGSEESLAKKIKKAIERRHAEEISEQATSKIDPQNQVPKQEKPADEVSPQAKSGDKRRSEEPPSEEAPPLKKPVSITFAQPTFTVTPPAAPLPAILEPSESIAPAPAEAMESKGQSAQATTDFLNRIRLAGTAHASSRLYLRSGAKAGGASGRAGLDLGLRGYKWVALDRKKRLQSIAVHDWKDIEEAAEEGAREEVLKELVEKTRAQKALTTLSLRSDMVSYQVLDLPLLARAEMLKAVRWELRKKGLLESQDALVDAAVIEQKTTSGKALVLAVVAKEPYVTDTIQSAQALGLIVEEVQTVVQALDRIVKKGNLFASGEDGAILEMGYASSKLCFFKGSDLKYARVFAVGGRDFHSAITGSLISDDGTIDLSVEDAQALLRVVGIPSDEGLRTGPAKAFLYQVSSRLRPILEDLVGELRRSLEYYLSSSGLGPVETLLLCGGMGGVKGLPEYLGKELGFSVKVLEPFDVLGLEYPETFRKTTSQSSFTVALGLALEGGHRMALMPVAYRARLLDRAVMRWASIATAAALFGFAVIGAGIKLAQWRMERHIGHVGQQLASCAVGAEKCRTIIALSNHVAQREKEIIGFASRQPLWEGVLKEVSYAIPGNVLLREISVIPASFPRTLTMVGTIYASNLSVDAQLSSFMERMAASPYFSRFDLVNRQNIPDAEKPASAFEVQGVLRY